MGPGSSARDFKMAEKPQGKGHKRKHFQMTKSRQSPFQNPKNSGEPAGIVSKAPRGINAAEFAESRALEIHNMMQALSSASKLSNKRVFQSVPRHMRRRAASHNSKRMPVRLRDAYNREVGRIIASFICDVYIFLARQILIIYRQHITMLSMQLAMLLIEIQHYMLQYKAL